MILQASYNAVGAVWVPNPLPPFPPESSSDVIEFLQLNTWVDKAQEVLATLNTVVRSTPYRVRWCPAGPFSNSLRPSIFRLHALTNPPSLPVPYKWVQDIWLEAAQYDYEAELAKSPLERGTILLDDRRIDICAELDEEGALGEVTTTVPSPPGPVIAAPLPHTAVVRPWDSTTARDPRMKGRVMVSAWGTAEVQLRSRISGSSTAASRPFSFQEPRVLDLFLTRAVRLTAEDRRNLSLVELSRRFGLSVVDTHQLKTHGVANLSSLASAILAARELQRLAHVQPFPVRRSKDALLSRALPAPLVETVVRAD